MMILRSCCAAVLDRSTLPCLLVLLGSAPLWACKTTDEGPHALVPDAKGQLVSDQGMLLECAGLQPERSGSCEAGDPAIVALVKAIRNPAGRNKAIDAAFSQLDLSKLSIQERIIAQNAALYLGTIDGPERLDALRLVRSLALPPEELDKLGDELTPEIERWLGPRSAWKERGTRTVPLEHEQRLGFTQTFRPVEANGKRALIGQLVAVDKRWGVHVTPYVGVLAAFHTPKVAQVPAACVALDDIEARRCGAAAGLESVAELNPPPADLAPFVVPAGDARRASCSACHGLRNDPKTFTEDLTPEQAKAHAQAARDAFLTEARAMVAKLHEIINNTKDADAFNAE